MTGPYTDYCRAARADGGANWLLNAAAEDYLCGGDDTVLAVLVEFATTDARKAFVAKQAEAQLCWPLGAFAHDRYCPVLIQRRALAALDTGRLDVERVLLGAPVAARARGLADRLQPLLTFRPQRSGLREGAQEAIGFPRGTRVVMGVIDDGIAVAHDRFRDGPTSTRVFAHWAMEAFPGKELLKPEIDRLLRASCRNGVVDEDEVYRSSGLVDYRTGGPKTLERRIAHGTHICDLAAGEDWSADGSAWPIIAVSLPADVLADTSGRFLDAHLAMAIGYILDRARRLAGDDPVAVVITASIGTIAGPHDGSSLIEQMMDSIVKESGGRVSIVLPAGNAHLSRCYAELPLDQAEDGEADEALEWVLLPDDRTMSSMQVWLPEGPAEGRGARLRLTTPAGAFAEVREGDRDPVHISVGGQDVAMVHWRRDSARNRGVFDIWTLPTMRDEPSCRPVAPAGRWRIALLADRPGEGVGRAWIQRDDSLYGYPLRGRQSYFDHPRFERFKASGAPIIDDCVEPDGPIKRRNLLNALASGSRTLVAGGYVRSVARPARYSAGGGPEIAAAPKPDVLLPSERSPAARGIIAAGARSGARVALGGTSVAAPLLARLVANRLERGRHADRAAMADVVTKCGALLPRPTKGGSVNRIGRGLLPVLLPEDALGGPQDRFERPEGMSTLTLHPIDRRGDVD